MYCTSPSIRLSVHLSALFKINSDSLIWLRSHEDMPTQLRHLYTRARLKPSLSLLKNSAFSLTSRHNDHKHRHIHTLTGLPLFWTGWWIKNGCYLGWKAFSLLHKPIGKQQYTQSFRYDKKSTNNWVPMDASVNRTLIVRKCSHSVSCEQRAQATQSAGQWCSYDVHQ